MREKKTTNYYKVKYSLFFISLILIFIVNLNFISASEPVISTLASSNINPYSATLNGRISYMGDYDMLNVTFQFCNVVVGCEWTPIQYITGEGVFSQTITGLTPLTTYSYKVGWFESEGIFGGAGTERNLTTTSGIQSGNTITNKSVLDSSNQYLIGYTLWKPQKTYSENNDFIIFENLFYDYDTYDLEDYNPFLQDLSFNFDNLEDAPIFFGASKQFDINLNGHHPAIHPTGDYVAFTGDNGDILYIYQRSGNSWVKIHEENYSDYDYEIDNLHFTRNGLYLVVGIYDTFADNVFLSIIDVGDWESQYTSFTQSYDGSPLYAIDDIASNERFLAVNLEFEDYTERLYVYDIDNNFNSVYSTTLNADGRSKKLSIDNQLHFSNNNNYLLVNYYYNEVERGIVLGFSISGTTFTQNSLYYGGVSPNSRNITSLDISYDSQYFVVGEYLPNGNTNIVFRNLASTPTEILREDTYTSGDGYITNLVMSKNNQNLLLTYQKYNNFSAGINGFSNGYDILIFDNSGSINYLPTIFTLPVSDVTTTGIKLNGRLTSLEGYDNVNAFFEIHISNTFGFNASYITDVVQLTNIGDFSEDLNYQYFPFDNLIDNQVLWLNAEYYTYRAVLEINGQYIYGELLNEDYENENIHLTNDTIDTEMEGQESVFKEVSKISGLFPDADGLTTRTKFFYVILTIAIISIVLLLVGGGINGVNPLMLYIVAFIDALLFFLFVAIGYIPVVMVIMVLMGLIAIVYFKFKGGG